MKVNLEFNLPDEREEYQRAIDGNKAYAALHDIRQEVFRPFRKHGSPDPTIQKLVEKLDTLADENGDGGATHLISLLETKFSEILDNWDVEDI